MHRARRAGGSDALGARNATIAVAAAVLDAELARAPVDEQFVLVLRACAHGGRRALEELCASIADPSNTVQEAPARALVAAVADDDAAARAVRSAAWMMAAQRISETWPNTWFDVLTVAREAMPLDDGGWERVRQLALLTTVAIATEDAGDRDGMHFQFSRESLENVIGAATGRVPVRRDMLHVIPYWTASFRAGIRACDERLGELGSARPAR